MDANQAKEKTATKPLNVLSTGDAIIVPALPPIDPVALLTERVAFLEKSLADLSVKVVSMYVAPVPVDGKCKSNTWNEKKGKLVRCMFDAGHAPLPCDFGPKD
jgi:hypothetical protein